MINIDKGISIILHDWLNVGKDELIHFITDEAHMREAEAISRWAYGADAVLKTTILNSQLVQKGDVIEGMTDIFCKESAPPTSPSLLPMPSVPQSGKGLVSFLCRCPVPTVPRFWKTTSSR